jgi:hypothetical protein
MNTESLSFALPMRALALAGLAAVCSMWLASRSSASESPPASGEPEVREDGSVRFRAQGEFRSNQHAARENALHAVQDQMRAWLAKQEPPIRRAPSLDVINREMIHQQEPVQEETVGKDRMYKITIVVDLTPAHVRDLRERDRAFSGLWTLGAVLAILCVVSLAFRIDEWTKGYLTRWLVVGGVALTTGLVGLWWFAH